MKCPVCGLEAMIESSNALDGGRRELIYACRNKRCEKHGKEVGRKTLDTTAKTGN